MSGFNWACPTCGAATHSKEALVRSSEKSCSCDSALWVASDMPPCVGKLQEEIAALRAEKLTDASALRLALERIAALEKVAETASEILRLCAKNFERSTLWADWQNLDDALREAGYLGGVE